jgi:hypothetical protein
VSCLIGVGTRIAMGKFFRGADLKTQSDGNRRVNKMKIEAGKYYKTRDGHKVGPMKPYLVDEKVWHEKGDGRRFWIEDGTRWVKDFYNDIIEEWQDDEPKPSTDLAALAKQHGIKITVQVGEVFIEYDGRV